MQLVSLFEMLVFSLRKKKRLALISPLKTGLDLLQSFAFGLRDKNSSEDDIESTESREHPERPCAGYGILKRNIIAPVLDLFVKPRHVQGKYMTVSSP